jgi:ribosomal protein S18 acetylase RimI-like enzyme
VAAGFVVRTTTVGDAFTLQAVVAAVARERRYLGSTDGFTLAQTRDYIARLHAAGGVQLVALAAPAHGDRRRRTGQELLGWVDILPGPFEGLTHCGRLGMGVASAARGQGVGRTLLAHALEAGFRTLERIELEVFASNARARALYLRAGFVEEGRRRCARKLDGACDDILMFGLLRAEWRGASLDPRVTPQG